jgi:hypothetical protein
LGLVFRGYLPDGLDLEDDGFKADEIRAETLGEFHSMLRDGQLFLGFKRDAATDELTLQAFLID